MLAEQMILIIKYYHDRNIIHRDIKPDNFLLDFNRPAKHIYLIDFGFAKKYRSSKTQKHIPYTVDKPYIGTPRYMSINALSKREQSRRDDMYSIGYMIVFMLMGKLPWQGILRGKHSNKYQAIKECKQKTSNHELTYKICCKECLKSG